MKEIPKPSITEVFEYYGARVLGADNGGWSKATCALLDHDDKSPSASINESECRWKCWSCDKGGDAVDLVMANECSRLVDAIRFTAEQFGSGDSPVRAERGSTGLLPKSQGHRPGRRIASPPWLRF